jgi:hypothetical protein
MSSKGTKEGLKGLAIFDEKDHKKPEIERVSLLLQGKNRY